MTDERGDRLLRFNWEVTVVFALLTGLSWALDGSFDVPYAVLCAVLFGAGVIGFVVGFWNGAQRSRTELVTLSGLLAVDTSHVPARARRLIWSAVTVQTIVATAAAVARPFTTQAFGLLVPMFGVGVAILWGARNARFHLRETA